MQQFRRLIAAAMCLIVGSASFALSYVALRDVAVRVHAVPAYLGFIVPIVIDGGIICGSSVIWALSKEDQRRPRFPFLFVGILVVVSVVVNISNAGPAILAKGIASLPPLVLLGTLELVAAQGRRHLAPAVVIEEVPEVPRAATEIAPAAVPSRPQVVFDDAAASAPTPLDVRESDPSDDGLSDLTPAESAVSPPPVSREEPVPVPRRPSAIPATPTARSRTGTKSPSRPAKSSGPPRPIRMPATGA